ncbi:MAG: sugar phosphate isomerase/epimerase [Actinobacteria bacterium]|nr:sugar phosphate isomerase/epimerase [Actinomycetota bacterium]MCG2808440.1 sugar phosphate isomerase/epimerase [Coriobacteriia bacterium]
MELAMATDYAGDTGNAEPALTRIAEAGFRHIQWIHHWRHDFIYTEPEIRHIAQLLKRLELKLYDIHAPAGAEKNWYSTVEYQRQAGVEIIKNRVEMSRTLGGSVIVVHTPTMNAANRGAWSQLRRSLDDLEGFCSARSVKIAVENRSNDKFVGIRELFSEYGPDFLGLCYDSGHGNIGGTGLQHLDSVKERLISLHLHDNDGKADQHRPVFSGTIDWQELARIVAESPYDEFLTFETEMRRSGLHDESLFLEQVHSDGLKLLSMVRDQTRSASAV